jgi:hypothetical protein
LTAAAIRRRGIDNNRQMGDRDSAGEPMKIAVVLIAMVASFCMPNAGLSHDWYWELKQPGNGQSCCGDNDCHRIEDDQARIFDGQLQIYIKGSWRKVNPYLILNRTSPDGHLHACWVDANPPTILCIILPPES